MTFYPSISIYSTFHPSLSFYQKVFRKFLFFSRQRTRCFMTYLFKIQALCSHYRYNRHILQMVNRKVRDIFSMSFANYSWTQTLNMYILNTQVLVWSIVLGWHKQWIRIVILFVSLRLNVRSDNRIFISWFVVKSSLEVFLFDDCTLYGN